MVKSAKSTHSNKKSLNHTPHQRRCWANLTAFRGFLEFRAQLMLFPATHLCLGVFVSFFACFCLLVSQIFTVVYVIIGIVAKISTWHLPMHGKIVLVMRLIQQQTLTALFLFFSLSLFPSTHLMRRSRKPRVKSSFQRFHVLRIVGGVIFKQRDQIAKPMVVHLSSWRRHYHSIPFSL